YVRPLLAGRDSGRFDRVGLIKARAAEAYELLLGPAGDAIRGKDLVIVPSGVLSRFPFHLLVEPGGNPLAGPFLIQRHRVRYAPPFSALHLTREWDRTRPRPSQPFWGVGDPIYQADDPRASVGPAPAESGRKPRAPDDTRDDPRSDSLSPERLPRLEWSGA